MGEMGKMVFVILKLCLLFTLVTVETRPTERVNEFGDLSGLEPTIRKIRSIANIAKLLLGGNASPDHPLVKFQSFNPVQGTPAASIASQATLPPLTSQPQQQQQQNFGQQTSSAFTPGPPYYPQTSSPQPQSFNYNQQQTDRYPSQYSQQANNPYYNNPAPYNANRNFGQNQQSPPPYNPGTSSSVGQSAYIPSSVIYSPPRNRGNNRPPPQNFGNGQGPSNNYQQNNNAPYNNYQNQQQPPPPQPYQVPQTNPYPPQPHQGPNSIQQQLPHFQNNYQQGPPSQNYNQNQGSNQPLNGNQNNLGKPSTNQKPSGPITSTLNAISSYFPKFSWEVSANRRDSPATNVDLDQVEQNLNSNIRRDEVITEVESQFVDTTPTDSGTTIQGSVYPTDEPLNQDQMARSSVPTSTYVSSNAEGNNNYNYNYMDNFRALEIPMEKESPVEFYDDSPTDNEGLPSESVHIIPSVAIYHASYVN